MGVYAVINVATGLVENTAEWDGESEWVQPEGYIVVPANGASIGWSYVDGKLIAPPEPEPPVATPAEILERNTGMRDFFLARATLAIAPLQDAVDLDDATPAEAALLKKWKQYRVAVNRIDLTLPSPTWPNEPA